MLLDVVEVDEAELRFKWSELFNDDKGGRGEGGGTRCNLGEVGTCRSGSSID